MRTFQLLLLIIFTLSLSNATAQKSFFPNADSEGWLNLMTADDVGKFLAMGTDSVERFHPRSLLDVSSPDYKALNACFFFKPGITNNWDETKVDLQYGDTPLSDGMAIFSNKVDGVAIKWDYPNSGGIIFKLPSCKNFEIVTSASGSFIWGVYTSIDNGNTWVTAIEPVEPNYTFPKGTWLYNLKDSVSAINSSSPIWVKIKHAGSGNVYIHKLKINTVDNATTSASVMLSDIQIRNYDGYLSFSKEVHEVELTSVTGAVVLKDANINQINTSNFAKGLYIIKALDRDGKIKIEKVVF